MSLLSLLSSKQEVKKNIVKKLIPILILTAMISTLATMNLSIGTAVIVSFCSLIISIVMYVMQTRYGRIGMVREFKDINNFSTPRILLIMISEVAIVILIAIIYFISMLIATLPIIISPVLILVSIILYIVFTIIFVVSAILIEVAVVDYLNDQSHSVIGYYFRNSFKYFSTYKKDVFQYGFIIFMLGFVSGIVLVPFSLFGLSALEAIASFIVTFFATCASLWTSITLIEVIMLKKIGGNQTSEQQNDEQIELNLHDDM